MTNIPQEKSRVMIVNDDQKVLALLSELLEYEGYEIASASNGGSALALATSFSPDVVISDVVMPVLDGIELCRRLKSDPRTSSIPVLLISGLRNDPEDTMQGLTAGADDYLAVPFRNEEFLVKVARLAERRRVEKHYREIVEQAADIIYTRNMEGYVTSINTAGARFFGKPAAEIVGRHLSTLIGSEDATRDIEQTKKDSDSSPPRSTYYLKDHEGNGRYLEGVLTIERDRQRRPTGIRGVVRDITERKLAERELQESEERYRRLVELSPDAIIVHSDCNLVYVNPAAVKLWGANSADELLGRSLLERVHPDYRRAAEARIRDVQQSGTTIQLTELKQLRLNGEVIDVEVTGMSMVFQGRPAVQSVIRDITERKQGREALRQTETQLRTVVSSASLVLFALDRDGVFTLSEGEGLKAARSETR